MAKVKIVSVSEDQDTVMLSNGIVLKAVEGTALSCGDCYFAKKDVCCSDFDFCTSVGRKDKSHKWFVVDESKCIQLEVIIDGRKFTADNTADAKWLKDFIENKLEEK